MKKWQLFEKKACEFLNKNFSSSKVHFEKVGGSDSTLSDIKVIKNNNIVFFIESKMSGAQCGQFVLLDNGGKFTYSPRNKSLENQYSKKFLNHINNDYMTFKDVSTRSIEINVDKKTSYNWVLNNYMTKNVKFIITGNSLNNFIIFPLSKFNKYFDIKANFRVKKSGSRNLSKKNSGIFYKLLKDKYSCSKPYYVKRKAFIEIYDGSPENLIVEGEDYDYLLKRIDSNKYEIRMLSNTFNANVIFSCELKAEQDKKDLIAFKNHVN